LESVKQLFVGGEARILAGIVAAAIVAYPLFAQSSEAVGGTLTPAQGVTLAKPGAPTARPAPVWQGSQANRLSQRAERYYEGAWGVGEFRVKVAESGELIRFNYRVLDPDKAAALNDKKAEPELFDAQAGVKLSVPQMEKVGKLRQESTPKAGMTYWMAFSNPTLAVRRGDRVDVVIGSFRATNLVVE
jgi:hypothetical protein